jgi:predicted glycogen debranching enzyme
VSDILTRRYHGLLVAAIQPPLGRRVLLAKLDASVRYREANVDLGANQWTDRSISPRGDARIASFQLDGTIPTTRYAFSDAQIERTVWMERGADSTYIRYRVAAAAEPVTFTLKAYVDDRDFHSLTHAYDVGETTHLEGRCASIRMRDGIGWKLAASSGSIGVARDWYYGFFLAAENERGLDDTCDLLHAATITATIDPGAALTVMATRHVADLGDADASLQRARDADALALADFQSARAHHRAAPAWINQMALAADQFIVSRSIDSDDGKTVIAGYHWFGDWGRDTMISLGGLTLSTGRAPIARSILATFAQYLSEGMLPNRFPDSNTSPEYNTVDAALWFVDAIREYTEATNDTTLVASIYDALTDLIEWHVRGTRFGIVVDSSDGLLRAGEHGVQLTWMDAKVSDWVVTPRIGKPVEINALWYNALRCMDGFAQTLGRDASRFRELAGRARASFARFWNDETGYLFDVLDGPEGNDSAIRPNAVIAVSLPFRALDQTRERTVVDRAAQCLLTPFGLRSLDPAHPAYVGSYGGGVGERDSAYHQGTVWPYLIGPYLRAHLNAYGNPAPLLRQLELFATRIMQYGAGTLAEIADGDAPHEPRGCIAQAWSVAHVLAAWSQLSCHPELVEGTRN